MASRHVQKILSPRNRLNSLSAEREQFEKEQLQSISKAINTNEVPVKEKHVRRIIIGTYQEKCSATFFGIVRRMPLQESGSAVMCWKFCHVMHKLLREGYRRVIADSYLHKNWIAELGKLWILSFNGGYGKLISSYCGLLINKIDFHMRNPKFPGNLQVTDEELDNIGEQDVNIFFQLSCELFDYLDEILSLQNQIFNSLDMSRSNSMTNQGQCRLAPLIPCIQDSSQLYDFSVKVLFKLHAVLPASTLDGHRQRFLHQYKILKQFYNNSSNLQYFRKLIEIPSLPEKPPNFLLASDLESHVTPIVIVPQETQDGILIDINYDEEIGKYQHDSGDFFAELDGMNSSVSYNESMDDHHSNNHLSMAQVQQEFHEMKHQFDEFRTRHDALIGDLRATNTDLQMRAVELKEQITSLIMERDQLQKEKEDLRQEMVSKTQVSTDVEAEKAQEKYQKLREIYNQLRAEHINLLRKKADIDKQLISLNSEIEKAKSEAQHVTQLKNDLSRSENQLNQMQDKWKTSDALNKKLLQEISSIQIEKNQFNETMENYKSRLSEYQHQADLSQLQLEQKHIINYLSILRQVMLELHQNSKSLLSEDNESENLNVNFLCTPEFCYSQTEQLLSKLDQYLSQYKQLCAVSKLTEADIPACSDFTLNNIRFYLSLIRAFESCKVVYHVLPDIQVGNDLILKFRSAIGLFSSFLKKASDEDNPFQQNLYYELRQLKLDLTDINETINQVLPQIRSNRPGNLQEILMHELCEMEKAIQDAADKIGEILEMSKLKDTDIKLEVNGKILDSCTSLMTQVMRLVNDSRELQKEIFFDGKGQINPNEFYQKNHRWTEGLISAAKVVAFSAKLLVDSADQVVKGESEFETLIVASQEIASATAQLVAASKVKARSESEKMKQLIRSSKEVTKATGQIIAITKNSSQMMSQKDNQENLEEELNRLTVHQAKKLEMESQLRIIQLEDQLNKERVRLSQLRKSHYHS